MPSGYENSPGYGDPPPNRWEWVYWVALVAAVAGFIAWVVMN